MGRDRNDVDQQHHQDSLSELSNPNITPTRISDSASRHHRRHKSPDNPASDSDDHSTKRGRKKRKPRDTSSESDSASDSDSDEDGSRRRRRKRRARDSSSESESVSEEESGKRGRRKRGSEEEEEGEERRRRRGKRKSRRRDSESESEDERRRRKRRERSKREEERERKRRKREKEKKRRKKEKKKERGKKGAVTDSWGKYGTVKETDMWNKRPEFTAWLAEVKQVNLEALSNWEEKKMFKEYMEDYNTATFPSKKYYNLDAYHRRKMEKEQKKGFTKVLESVRTVFNDEEQRRQEMLRVREKQKEQEVEALKHSMQSGLAQAMKEQQRLREEMAYQYKIGNFEAAAAIQRRLDPDAAM